MVSPNQLLRIAQNAHVTGVISTSPVPEPEPVKSVSPSTESLLQSFLDSAALAGNDR